jgi:hypothetical protein
VNGAPSFAALGHSCLQTQFFVQFARDGKVVTARIRLVENMEIFTRQTGAPEAIVAARAGHTLCEVGTRRAALTFNAVLAANKCFTVAAMRAIRATQATNAVVTTNQALGIRAEGAVAATLAARACDTTRIGGTLPQLADQIAKA